MKKMNIEDMRDWLRDHYLENAVDLLDDKGQEIIATEIYGASYTGSEQDIIGVIDDMGIVEIAEDYVYLSRDED